MKRALTKHKFFVTSLGIYLSGVVIFSIVAYFHEQKLALHEIDDKLMITATFAEDLLDAYLGDNIVGHRPLSLEEEYRLALKLQELANRMHVSYIYSLIDRGGEIVFVVSNPTPREKSLNEFRSLNLLPYVEAPAAAHSAFNTATVRVDEYIDRWGAFRSVFFPFQTKDRKPYLIGVDVKIDKVKETARRSQMFSLVYATLLGLLVVPVAASHLRTLRINYREKLQGARSHPITGLPNRQCLEIVLQRKEHNKLLLIEVTNFEAITNVIGIGEADELILKLSCHLNGLERELMSAYELYHLEQHLFAIHIDEDITIGRLDDIARGVYLSMRHIKSTHQLTAVTLTIRLGGVYNQPNAQVLARMALVHAKKTNQTMVMYDPSLDLPSYFQRYITVLNQLSDALQYDRIAVLFQPIFAADSGRIAKFEALARITNHEGRTICMPADFMPIAYQSRLCNRVTRKVLEKVTESLRSNHHIVSINLSVKDLFDQETREHIISHIRKEGIGNRIEFELLEQQSIGNYHLAGQYINELQDCCRGVGLDDMGKLYSNFDRLLTLPFDFVKIDGIVTETIDDNDAHARDLVFGVVSYARNKGIMVVAECCTSRDVCHTLAAMGVDLLQGFYLGEPRADFQVEAAGLQALNSDHPSSNIG